MRWEKLRLVPHKHSWKEKATPLWVFISKITDNREPDFFLRDVRYRIHAWFEFISQEKRMYNRPVAEENWADKKNANKYRKKMKTKRNMPPCLSGGLEKVSVFIVRI